MCEPAKFWSRGGTERSGANEALGIYSCDATVNRLIVDSVDPGIRQQYHEGRKNFSLKSIRAKYGIGHRRRHQTMNDTSLDNEKSHEHLNSRQALGQLLNDMISFPERRADIAWIGHSHPRGRYQHIWDTSQLLLRRKIEPMKNVHEVTRRRTKEKTKSSCVFV